MSNFFRAFLRLFMMVLSVSLAGRSSAALLLDDCETPGPPSNRLGGPWIVFHDPHSTAMPDPFVYCPDGYRSGHGARLDAELVAGIQYPYAGFGAVIPARDLSDYAGVRFAVKGAGDWTCLVATSATSATYNHYAYPLSPSGDWTLQEIPFTSLTQTWGPPQPWDVVHVTGLQWSMAGTAGSKGWICVDDVEFYKADEKQPGEASANPILEEPKVNQVGYPPDAEKYFALTEAKDGPKRGDAFRVLDSAGITVAFGKLKDEAVDDTPSTREKVFKADFTVLRRPGRYIVEAGGRKSPPFEIGTGVYTPLFKDALRCFYLIRCGTAIDDPVTGIRHAACHMKDAKPKDGGAAADLTGGWHNAGDFGKWTHEDAISCAWMMWLYELRPKPMAGLRNGIPETGNGVSDLLNEARWGLTWLLKMQNGDGSVRHKVDSEDHFCFGTSPEKDPFPRLSQGAGSLDAGVFVGAMCQASRVFSASNPVFAKKCFTAARRAWDWLEKNPQVVQTDTDYVDMDPSQEELWALGEMARTTGDAALVERFRKESDGKLRPVGWMEPQMFGFMAMGFGPSTPSDLKGAIHDQWEALCDPMDAASRANAYGVVLSPTEYYWECNETLLGRTACLLVGNALTGDEKYRDAALRQMDYLLGLNSLGRSFVTGYGFLGTRHPYHWTMAALGKLMPGWASGGPNQWAKGADPLLAAVIRAGTPPAKCFVDACGGNGSYASNEGETSENAALVFCAGYLSVE